MIYHKQPEHPRACFIGPSQGLLFDERVLRSATFVGIATMKSSYSPGQANSSSTATAGSAANGNAHTHADDAAAGADTSSVDTSEGQSITPTTLTDSNSNNEQPRPTPISQRSRVSKAADERAKARADKTKPSETAKADAAQTNGDKNSNSNSNGTSTRWQQCLHWRMRFPSSVRDIDVCLHPDPYISAAELFPSAQTASQSQSQTQSKPASSDSPSASAIVHLPRPLLIQYGSYARLEVLSVQPILLVDAQHSDAFVSALHPHQDPFVQSGFDDDPSASAAYIHTHTVKGHEHELYVRPRQSVFH